MVGLKCTCVVVSGGDIGGGEACGFGGAAFSGKQKEGNQPSLAPEARMEQNKRVSGMVQHMLLCIFVKPKHRKSISANGQTAIL